MGRGAGEAGGGVLSVTRARELSKRLSPTEVRLWRVLQTSPAGLRFRKQHPCGPFVLDFYCCAAGLAVEVDGLAHDFDHNVQRDQRRDQWVRDQGVETLRIAAEEVRANLECVVMHNVSRCLARTPPPRAARSPSPANAGEDVEP
ncbi:endonuclease domain-containing protein [Sphingomonas alba]|uniref:endonuclease domain-containing protein n=1 Tax=Sphingomonas alba TaxID=2908208 RepID=UPI003D69A2C0